MVTIEIVPNDTKMVAKAIILDSKNNVLFLKRSDYVEKFSGEWDLPGGHLKEGEPLLDGLVREVKEETGFCVKKPITFFKRLDNLHFFKCFYTGGKITLSNEHTDYTFMGREELGKYDSKFQKLALAVLREND